MRSVAILLMLLSSFVVFSTVGCEQKPTKPKEGVVDTSNPSNIVIPDSMKKGGTPAKPADKK